MKINSVSSLSDQEDDVQLPELVYWASLGDTARVRQLLADGIDPNQSDEEGYSALQAAAENDHLDVVKLLVSKGADISFKGQYTALELAEMAQNAQIVQYLKDL
ncbi:ankyrin repeat domain-containing protein [Acinetobacter sp. V89_7]|uniref:ankyrin repeat domain-containing protein n=1 Tax=Acinetobacter sp. V89_7 TaxID=3044233 RepID=UPI00249F5EF7|nr:ankyrin repeat domain-containing protein [Acinetobacter sp. V89_7]MDI3379527.1 ankyrin repeat domain-containing protein [Acinetobacter sp. V89_7]